MATDAAAYVQAAVRLAGDVARVRSGRAQLRAQMAGSALCDIGAYVKNFEALLQTMWDQSGRAGQTGQTQRLISADSSGKPQAGGRAKLKLPAKHSARSAGPVVATHESGKTLYCVGIACVRNEADVIEMWARYNLQLIDELHVVDNLSVDRTRWVLQQLQAEGLALHIHECDDPSHQQGVLMSRVARAVAQRPEVDCVVPLDADELLALPDRAALHAALATIPPGSAGSMAWCTYLPAPDAGADQTFFRRMTRHRSYPRRSKMNTGHASLLAVLLCTLQGCSTLLPQEPATAALVLPASWSATDAMPAGDLRVAGTPLADWWLRFDDPQLAALVRQALLANTRLQGAQAA